MAQRIALLEFPQSECDSPEHFVSKKLAAVLLTYRHNGKLAVVAISPFLLQIRVELRFRQLKGLLRSRDQFVLASGKRFVPSAYIPDKMPPRELPNPGWTRFIPPQSDQWKIQHRTLRPITQ